MASAVPVKNPLSFSHICIIQGKGFFLPQNCSITSPHFLNFPLQMFAKGYTFESHLPKAARILRVSNCECYIFPVRVHYTYRRQRGFLPCVARLPCPLQVISSSPFCPLPAVAEVLQTPEFVHSLPPSVYVHALSTEMWNIDDNGMNQWIHDCHHGALPYSTTFIIIINIMIMK